MPNVPGLFVSRQQLKTIFEVALCFSRAPGRLLSAASPHHGTAYIGDAIL
jgi:hypothetical protein